MPDTGYTQQDTGQNAVPTYAQFGVGSALRHTGAGGTSAYNAATVPKTADQIVNASTVLQNDTHFAWSVAANGVYYFQIFLAVTQVNTNPGIVFGLSLPAGATFDASGGNGQTGWTWPGNLLLDQGGVTLTNFNGINMGSGSTRNWITIAGIVFNGATAGTANFQWAQKVSDPTNLVVKKGSFLQYMRTDA